jgi:2-oxoisovalerate dehydrogenase E1 component subunit alpha
MKTTQNDFLMSSKIERGIMKSGQVSKEMQTYMVIPSVPSAILRDLYARMLLTRLVDDYTWQLHQQGRVEFVASCRGHEAVQVGSAVCIEVGKDFTLPYYRDLGVVLTIGMTPCEVFRTYLHMQQSETQHHHTPSSKDHNPNKQQTTLHWGYHKHNMVTGPAPVATQILHAAGIAFACKLQKARAVTVAYCGDGAAAEPDFLEGIRFAAQHQLPAVFVCEQDCGQSDLSRWPSSLQMATLPDGLIHQRIDGTDVIAVYTAMQTAMQHAREGHGPVLLEMCVSRSIPDQQPAQEDMTHWHDPLLRCQRMLEAEGAWDPQWAAELYARFSLEVKRALHDAL